VKNKADSIAEYLVDKDVDVCAVTETWLRTGDEDKIVIGNLIPDGYKLCHVARTGVKVKGGGGVAVIHRSNLKVTQQPTDSFSSFEHMEVLLSTANNCIRLSVVYRPPDMSLAMFQEEFSDYIDSHSTTSGRLLIVGDLNIHLESKTNKYACHFRELLNSHNLFQHVNGPTHEKGHTLDAVITRVDDTSLVDNLQLTPFAFSDHEFISFKTAWTKSISKKVTQSYRNLKGVDIAKFNDSLLSSQLVQAPPSDSDELVRLYNQTLTTLLDEQAPLKTKEVMLRPHAPWYNESIRTAKQKRRRAERKWRKTDLTVDKELLKESQKEVSNLSEVAKKNYYNDKISENQNNPKKLFSISNSLLKNNKDRSLPTFSSEKDIADRFVQFFHNKIANIRDNLGKSTGTPETTKVSDSEQFSKFERVTESDVSDMILKGNSKSCSLDPIPTSLLKELLPSLLPTLTNIINNSLQTSKMSSDLKAAIVTPLLKKSSLDAENMKNYRPVSNLPYLGKLIEKVAVNQIDSHLTKNNLHEPLQSAYRANHSVETAVLKVDNDIKLSLDKRLVVYLVLLDLSAAFDTTEHEVFDKRLTENAVGEKPRLWMKSYLSDRKQCVGINGTSSEYMSLKFGFPQGSLIGPFGFKLYTKPLTEIAKKHGVEIHLYADDTQLYTSFKPKDSAEALDKIEACIEEIRQWMEQNFLKLNDSKTEFVMFGTPKDLSQVSDWTVTVGDNEILPSVSARNIGAHMDSGLDMKTQISNTIKSCYYQIHGISKIRKFLTVEATKSLVNAFVTSRLDNLNSLLYGIPDTQLKRLQKVQNCAARLIVRQKKIDHITPILKDLHWLPVKYRIDYKILLLVFKCVIGKAPEYLSSLITPYVPTRPLRSESQLLLQEISTKKQIGQRAFSCCGPKLWKQLPLTLRKCTSLSAFKIQLKTHLFRQAYDI
jgi:hypothetical protein